MNFSNTFVRCSSILAKLVKLNCKSNVCYKQVLVMSSHPSSSEAMDKNAVENFREYLRINTVQPKPDYSSAVLFLQKIAKELQLPCKVYEYVPSKPIVVLTWEGTDPSLPSLLLNSHIDVVPVFPECWKCDPFGAVMDDDGNIFARGAQDMKCVGIQYVEAIRRLQSEGARFPRTVHVSFVPDEEIGGQDGMKLFVKSDDFKTLNLGFTLDEGLASPDDHFMVYYGERCSWWLEVTCTGSPGHGSMFIENNAAEKLRRIINSFLGFRDLEERRLKLDSSLALGDVTSVNLNIVQGGVQPNVVPAEYKATFDMRIPPTADLERVEEQIAQWCVDAGPGVEYKFIVKASSQEVTSTSPDNAWWTAFSKALESMNLKTKVTIFPAGTDSKYIRQAGFPAIGFSPMNNTPVLLHDHNEFLNRDVFLRGITIYTNLIRSLASLHP